MVNDITESISILYRVSSLKCLDTARENQKILENEDDIIFDVVAKQIVLFVTS